MTGLLGTNHDTVCIIIHITNFFWCCSTCGEINLIQYKMISIFSTRKLDLILKCIVQSVCSGNTLLDLISFAYYDILSGNLCSNNQSWYFRIKWSIKRLCISFNDALSALIMILKSSALTSSNMDLKSLIKQLCSWNNVHNWDIISRSVAILNVHHLSISFSTLSMK